MGLERNVKKKPARTTDRRNVWLLIVTTILVVISVALFTPPNEKINQGLDIQGGLSVVLTAKSDDGGAVSSEDLEKSRAIIESRVNALGASEATVQVQGDNQILVQIPGLSDTEAALSTIGKTGSLTFARLDSFTDDSVVSAIRSGQYANEGTYTDSFGNSFPLGRDPASHRGSRHVHAACDRRADHERHGWPRERHVDRLRRQRDAQLGRRRGVRPGDLPSWFRRTVRSSSSSTTRCSPRRRCSPPSPTGRCPSRAVTPWTRRRPCRPCSSRSRCP